MKALILAGGDLEAAEYLQELLTDVRLVLAADSGLRHARLLGLTPDAIVGDFDSVSAAELERYPGLPSFEHPVDKDQLDLELAIEMALLRGAEELVVVGAFGSRLDQSLASLLICARLSRTGIGVSLHDGNRDAYVISTGQSLSLSLPDGTVFSLLALEDSHCSVKGADYQLMDAHLPFGVGVGLANRAAGGPELQVHEGLVALIVERSLGRGQRIS